MRAWRGFSSENFIKVFSGCTHSSPFSSAPLVGCVHADRKFLDVSDTEGCTEKAEGRYEVFSYAFRIINMKDSSHGLSTKTGSI